MSKQPYDIDDFDKNIIMKAKNDPSISVKDLAKQVHLSPASVSRRLSKLEKTGLMRKSYLLSTKMLGYSVECIAFVKIEKKPRKVIEELIKRMKAYDEQYKCIVEVWALFGEIDFMLKIIARDNDQLLATLMALREEEAIASVDTHLLAFDEECIDPEKLLAT